MKYQGKAARVPKSGYVLTQFIGVYRLQSGQFWARVKTGSVDRYLGHLDAIEDSARAYDAAIREIHGALSVVNFPFAEGEAKA